MGRLSSLLTGNEEEPRKDHIDHLGQKIGLLKWLSGPIESIRLLSVLRTGLLFCLLTASLREAP
jgi:hypothetical protein